MSDIVNNATYITKGTTIGAPHPNTVIILLSPVKEEDG